MNSNLSVSSNGKEVKQDNTSASTNGTQSKKQNTNSNDAQSSTEAKTESAHASIPTNESRIKEIVDKMAKTIELTKIGSEGLLVLTNDTKEMVASHESQIKGLKLKNMPVPREIKALGIAKPSITPEERRVNRSKIKKLEEDLPILRDWLYKLQTRLKEVTNREQKESVLEKIRNNAQSKRYIQKSSGFIGKKFTKPFTDILNGKLDSGAKNSKIISVNYLNELKALADKYSNKGSKKADSQQKTELDKEFDEKLISLFSEIDVELEAFYSHDLKSPLRSAIQIALSNWDNKKKNAEFPAIKISLS